MTGAITDEDSYTSLLVMACYESSGVVSNCRDPGSSIHPASVSLSKTLNPFQLHGRCSEADPAVRPQNPGQVEKEHFPSSVITKVWNYIKFECGDEVTGGGLKNNSAWAKCMACERCIPCTGNLMSSNLGSCYATKSSLFHVFPPPLHNLFSHIKK